MEQRREFPREELEFLIQRGKSLPALRAGPVPPRQFQRLVAVATQDASLLTVGHERHLAVRALRPDVGWLSREGGGGTGGGQVLYHAGVQPSEHPLVL
jgi:hypothetical protein